MINKDSVAEMLVKRDIWDTVDYVEKMFLNAIEVGASDIHVEPTEKFLLIRFRKDWDFLLIDKLHNDNVSAIITRLKVLAKVKIDENKKPQDWKLVYYYEKEKLNIDVRFSTLPTKYWEKVVMRILKQDDSLTKIEALWLIDVNVETVKESLKVNIE